MTWQPIDTAPKDGTEILGWDGMQRFLVRWREFSAAAQKAYKRQGEWYGEDECGAYVPTHWQPLPEPPEG